MGGSVTAVSTSAGATAAAQPQPGEGASQSVGAEWYVHQFVVGEGAARPDEDSSDGESRMAR